jgi:hypothetical protein
MTNSLERQFAPIAPGSIRVAILQKIDAMGDLYVL